MLDPGMIHPSAGISLDGSRWPPCHSFPWHQRAPQHVEIPKTPSWKEGSGSFSSWLMQLELGEDSQAIKPSQNLSFYGRNSDFFFNVILMWKHTLG